MAVATYLNFDLRITREAGYFIAYVIDSPAGQAAHSFRLPFSPLELENLFLHARPGGRAVRRADSPDTAVAKDFGARLFDTVFAGQVRDCLRSSLDAATREGAGLRIRLRLADATLVNLPWELLYNQELNRFLALSADTPLVRYIEMPEATHPLKRISPLRILVMIASPRDFGRLNVEEEWNRLRTAVADLEKRGLVHLERLEEASLTALQRRLRKTEYHIFHFIGHGTFDRQTQDGLLVLVGDDGLSQTISGQDLAVTLHDQRSLGLVILNACQGGCSGDSDPFAGVAQSLVQQGLPAVVAMQFEISDAAAVRLSHEFYLAVADGWPVDAALAEARKALFSAAGNLEWATPVLYMRAADGRIFDLAAAPAAPAPAAPKRKLPALAWAGAALVVLVLLGVWLGPIPFPRGQPAPAAAPAPAAVQPSVSTAPPATQTPRPEPTAAPTPAVKPSEVGPELTAAPALPALAATIVPPATAVSPTLPPPTEIPIPRVAVPNLAGSAPEAAGALLTGRGLAVGQVLEEISETVPKGSVIDTDPPGGERLLPGTAVNLRVSKGRRCQVLAAADLPGSDRLLAEFHPRHTAGDTEFNGNGPMVRIGVNTTIADDLVKARIVMSADEVNGDTKAEGSRWTTLYEPQPGEFIRRLADPKDRTDWSMNMTGSGAVRSARPGNETVQELVVIGDTTGNDVDADVNGRTGVQVKFRESRATVLRGANECASHTIVVNFEQVQIDSRPADPGAMIFRGPSEATAIGLALGVGDEQGPWRSVTRLIDLEVALPVVAQLGEQVRVVVAEEESLNLHLGCEGGACATSLVTYTPAERWGAGQHTECTGAYCVKYTIAVDGG